MAAAPSSDADLTQALLPHDAHTQQHEHAAGVINDKPDMHAFSDPAVPLSYRAQWVAFWVLGTINNFGYVVVGAAAKSLADSFDQSDLIGAIQWANVGIGLFLRLLNTFYLEGTSFRWRVAANTLLMLCGLVALSLSVYVNFSFAIFAIVMLGGSSSFGESVILGYLKQFAPSLTGAWSSGTGMAGVGGSLAYLSLYSGAGLTNQDVFLLLIPTVAVYWIAFWYVSRDAQLHGVPERVPTSESEDSVPKPTRPNSDLEAEDGDMLLRSVPNELGGDSQASDGVTVSSPPPGVEETTWERTQRVLSLVLSPATQLMLVYFFEYVVSVGFAAIANRTRKHPSWWRKNAFELLAFCYQFGVLISRSSVTIYQIRRIEVLTVLQGANFVLWLLHGMYIFIPLWLQFVLMMYCGLLGGAMYVNVFYLLIEDKRIRAEDKELAINLTAIFINFGIVTAAIFEIVSDKTYLSDEVDASTD